MPSPVELWNQRIHYYLGLYFLFFIWLFGFTGLLLNHPEWHFADFWPTRKQSGFERNIERPPAGNPDLDQARDLMRQLGLSGEIEWTVARANADRLDFRVSRPGRFHEIRADFSAGRATVQSTEVNAWGVMRILHTFTGVRLQDSRNRRDWMVTTVWAVAMDALAAGLMVMVLGGYYMWWRLPRKRLWGTVALAAGWAACGVFVAGLRWLTA